MTPTTIAAGTKLGPYEVLAPLGRGGMGEVYRARDTRLLRELALKVLPTELASDSERLERFEQEARAASALNHPAIVTVYDVGRTDGVGFIAMELVDGESLRDALARGPLPIKQALDLARQVAEALAAAHAAGIVHRDLKPENVMVTRGGRAKLLDFGLAKHEAPAAGGVSSLVTEDGALTKSGTVLGTAGYMSPEQVRGQSAGPRSDVFSFGALLYELLAGRRAFARASAVETMHAVLHDDPEPLPRVKGAAAVESLVRQCLEKDPAARPASGAELAARLAALVASAPSFSAPPRVKAIDSVAVLPFANAEPEQEYLSDGLTESLIHALSKVGKLRVMARSTVFKFKGTDDPLAVGRELGVGAVLTGTLRRHGREVRLNAELVEAASGFQLWGEQYDRHADDLLVLENEIADEICRQLRLKPGPRRVKRGVTKSADAHRAYLQGRFFWNKWTPDGMRQSIKLYEEAIALDPAYALAFAGVADAYAVLGNIKAMPPSAAFPRAKGAALRALELDPQLGEAHASLGFVRRFFDWDWPAAERAFIDAIRLSPGYATGHRWYGQFLSGLGRHERAVAEVKKALDLDPLSVSIHTALGDVLFYARRYDEAIAYYEKAIEMDPGFLAGHSDLARALEHRGRIDEAIREYQTAVAIASGTAVDPSTGLANALAVAARHGEARAVLEELKKRRAESYVSPWGLASIYARLGETESALEWLERAYDEHDSTLVWLKVHPRFDALRGEPRFAALMAQMGLSAGPTARE